MKRVVLESPFAGDIDRNLAYARAAIRDSLSRDEAPIASHLLYTQPGILDDDNATERAWGISAGHAWIEKADLVAVYADHGISNGMRAGINAAELSGIPVEVRYIQPPSVR